MADPLPPGSRRTMAEIFASIYNGEKPELGIDKWIDYLDVYERHLSHLRDRPIRMLEIGVQGGGSNHMWREYFHPDSQIFGIDIDPEAAGHVAPGVKFFLGDQADPAFLQRVAAEIQPLDVVVEDGGHTMNQMIQTFESLYAGMAPNGVFIVEDTHTCVWGDAAHHDRRDGKTFLDLAFQHCKELMDWTGDLQNFAILRTERYKELEAKASEFCRSTLALHFYDSMVVYERGRRLPPRCAHRQGQV